MAIELLTGNKRKSREFQALGETELTGLGDSTVTKSFPPELRRIDAYVMVVSSSGLGQLSKTGVRREMVLNNSLTNYQNNPEIVTPL